MAPALRNFSGLLPQQAVLRHWPLWLALCLLSRTLTSIHYIADPDSLRFVLGVQEFDLANLQPHFPGYPVFCFLVKGIYLLIGRFSYAFALAGGLATILLVFAGSWLYRQLLPLHDSWVFALLLFLNPMIWVMGNRYMPDLLGAALAMACLALYLPARNGNRNCLLLFFLLAGLLGGVRLSYIPIIMVPAALLLFRPGAINGIVAGAVGVLVWLLPMVIDTGWYTLIEVAGSHTEGHFTQWGGTVLSEPSHGQRLMRTAQFTLAHGLGAFWQDRHWATAVFAVLLVIAAAFAFKQQGGYREAKPKATEHHLAAVLALSGLLYLVWIYFYQNVVHQSRHVLPLLPVLLLLPAAGLGKLVQLHRLVGNAFFVLFLALNSWITFVLITQHRNPTAIYQVKEYLVEHEQPGQVVVSLDMINYYLQVQNVPGTLVSVETELQKVKQALAQGQPIWIVGSFPDLPGPKPALVKTFYHNPYVNSLWPEIGLYRYQP